MNQEKKVFMDQFAASALNARTWEMNSLSEKLAI